MQARTSVARAALSPPSTVAAPERDAAEDDVIYSGLQGKALRVKPEDIPTKAQVRAVVPSHCFKRSTARSLTCVLQSAVCTAACYALAPLIPLRLAYAPVWAAWTALTGTVAMGLWVLAHECGHGAFSDNRALQVARLGHPRPSPRPRPHPHPHPHPYPRPDRALQDAVGYVLHTALLVPYFSWQRSHAVHHAHTNHVTKGETHVPTVIDGVAGEPDPSP